MTADQLLGLPLRQAEALLRENGVCDISRVEYTAPGRERQGNDYRVIQARLDNGCATLVYAGFITTATQDTSEGDTDGDDD